MILKSVPQLIGDLIMGIIRRLQATIAANLDNAISRVENHDAVVDAALKEARSAAARARVRLARVQKEEANMHTKLSELQIMQQKWTDRAISTAKQEEAQALECVKRRNACEKQTKQIQEAIARHKELEKNVCASVDRIESRITDLTQQRNLMRSRHSAAEALRVINKIEGECADGIDDTFERWEMLVAETEYMAGSSIHVDTLNEAYVEIEETESLKADLADLLKKETGIDKEVNHE